MAIQKHQSQEQVTHFFFFLKNMHGSQSVAVRTRDCVFTEGVMTILQVHADTLGRRGWGDKINKRTIEMGREPSRDTGRWKVRSGTEG